MVSLFEDSDLKVLSIKPSLNRKERFANNITFRIFEEFIALQYIILGKMK